MMEKERAQRRQRECQGMWAMMAFHVGGFNAACIPLPTSAIDFRVAVE